MGVAPGPEGRPRDDTDNVRAVISFEEARTYVLERVHASTPVRIPVDDALGLVLAEDVVAPEAVPPFPNTAMDGFAVRAADTTNAPAKLTVVGTLAAGAAPGASVKEGEAIRIMTGAPMPPGADAVVMVELTEYDDTSGVVLVQQAVPVGNHIRPAGEDLERGSTVFTSGTALTAGHLGVLASIGHMTPLVYPRPRVGVLSTGDELIDGPQELQPGQIRDSNRHTLLALVARDHCIGVDLGCAPDTEEAITAAIERGLEHCDAIVTSGGVSMGAFDYVKVVLDRIGDMRWMQIAIKPAKPLAFGTAGPAGAKAAGATPIFGLPGNPVSSMVSFELFTRPALRKMMGHPASSWLRSPARAIADEAMHRHPDGKVHFNRVIAELHDDGRYHVRSAGGQGSHQLLAMAHANALAVLPDGDAIPAGGAVDVLVLESP
jgi:molybdopterin molybdotransferase